jgi:hypothetical protein
LYVYLFAVILAVSQYQIESSECLLITLIGEVIMQIDSNTIEKSSPTSNEPSDTKQHLITDEKFQLLRQCQQEVYAATEASPSMRKIINEIITEENLQKVKSKFIEIWKI